MSGEHHFIVVAKVVGDTALMRDFNETTGSGSSRHVAAALNMHPLMCTHRSHIHTSRHVYTLHHSPSYSEHTVKCSHTQKHAHKCRDTQAPIPFHRFLYPMLKHTHVPAPSHVCTILTRTHLCMSTNPCVLCTHAHTCMNSGL